MLNNERAFAPVKGETKIIKHAANNLGAMATEEHVRQGIPKAVSNLLPISTRVSSKRAALDEIVGSLFIGGVLFPPCTTACQEWRLLMQSSFDTKLIFLPSLGR